jgi:hypothetical protein
MAGVMPRLAGTEESSGLPNGSDLKRTSGSGECSIESQWAHSSVVEKPKGLAARPGEIGEGEPAESEVKSAAPKSSRGLKRDIGEKSALYVWVVG